MFLTKRRLWRSKQSLMSQSPAATKTIRLPGISKAAAIAGAALCIAATVTHFYLGAGAEHATGAPAILDHLFDLVAAATVSFVILSAGHSLTKRSTFQFINSAERLAFSFFLGTGVAGLLILLLGLAGLLRGWVMLTLLLLAVALTARDIPQLRQSLGRATRTAFATREARIFSILFIAFIGFIMLRTLAPPHSADELIYHLPVPRQFVQAGRIFPLFDNSLGNMPFLLHMVYAVFLLAGSDVAAKLFSLFLALATAVLLYAFCCRFLTRRVGVLAMFAFFASGMIVGLAVTTRIDVSLAGMLFACTYAMINYLTTRSRAWLWLSAVFAGFSLGIKHTAALWIFLVGILYLVETIKSREPIAKVVRYGVLYTSLALAVASPWYVKNAIWFHNPIYPFVTGEVADFGPNGVRYFNADDERKLDAHFEAARKAMPDVVAAQDQELVRAAGERVERHPMRLWEFFTRPNAYLMAEPLQLPNYLFLIIPFVVFLRPGKWIWWLLILGLGFLCTVTLTSWIARYLVPAYPALTIVGAHTLGTIATRLQPRLQLARILPQYLIALLLLTIIAMSGRVMEETRSLNFTTGEISRHDFFAPFPFYRPIDFINTQLPQNARVMSMGVQMTYGLDRPYLADETWFNTKWRRILAKEESLEDLNAQLKAQGFTHILYNRTLFIFAAKMGIEGTGGMNLITSDQSAQNGFHHQLLRNWATFTLYKNEFLEPVYSDDWGYQVLRIK